MKKLAAISLLILLLFNFIGYRFLFDALQQKANNELVSDLDNNNYKDADLVTITVPLSMPYISNWENFKRTDGEITLNGKIYHYVKQKVFDGKLILKCLPDEQKMNLQTAKNNFFKTQNDLQNNTSKKSGENSQVLKFFTGDYIKTDNSVNTLAVSNVSHAYLDNYSTHLQSAETLIPEQPPQA